MQPFAVMVAFLFLLSVYVLCGQKLNVPNQGQNYIQKEYFCILALVTVHTLTILTFQKPYHK